MSTPLDPRFVVFWSFTRQLRACCPNYHGPIMKLGDKIQLPVFAQRCTRDNDN